MAVREEEVSDKVPEVLTRFWEWQKFKGILNDMNEKDAQGFTLIQDILDAAKEAKGTE